MAEKLRPLDQVEMGRRVRSRREAIGLSRENLENINNKKDAWKEESSENNASED